MENAAIAAAFDEIEWWVGLWVEPHRAFHEGAAAYRFVTGGDDGEEEVFTDFTNSSFYSPDGLEATAPVAKDLPMVKATQSVSLDDATSWLSDAVPKEFDGLFAGQAPAPAPG